MLLNNPADDRKASFTWAPEGHARARSLCLPDLVVQSSSTTERKILLFKAPGTK